VPRPRISEFGESIQLLFRLYNLPVLGSNTGRQSVLALSVSSNTFSLIQHTWSLATHSVSSNTQSYPTPLGPPNTLSISQHLVSSNALNLSFYCHSTHLVSSKIFGFFQHIQSHPKYLVSSNTLRLIQHTRSHPTYSV